MNKKIIKLALPFMPLALLFMVQGHVYATNADSTPKKSETVFVNLDTKGTPEKLTVTDWLHSDIPGIKIKDRSILDDIVNVKSDESPVQDGKDITWHMKGNDIYYQGTTDKALPLDIDITYSLNGKKISPQKLAGKSGEVSISIKLKNTDKHTMDIQGSQKSIYTPMTVIVTINLPSDTFTNVKTSSGELFSDGNNQVVTFISMPGLKDSLNLDNMSIEGLKDIDLPEELTVTADAENFSLDGIGIAATPNLIDMDKIKDADDIDEMKQDLLDLKKTQDNLEIIDPHRDIRSLVTDTSRTDRCRLLINDLFKFYDIDANNKSLIDILPGYATMANINLYDKIKADLDDLDIGYILDDQTLRSLPGRLNDDSIDNLRKLVDDYDKLQDFDIDRLDPIVDVMDDYDDLEPMVDIAIDMKKSLDKHSNEVNTLETLSSYSDEVTTLYNQLVDSGLMTSLSDSQLQIFVNAGVDAVVDDMAGKSAAQYQSMIADDGTIVEENRTTVAYFITQAKAAGMLTDEQAQIMITAITSGDVYLEPSGENPGYDFRATIKSIIATCVESSASSQGTAMKTKILSMLGNLHNVDSQLQNDLGSDYQSDIKNALNYVNSDLSPNLRYLKKEADKNKKDLNKLYNFVADNDDNLQYLHQWAPDLEDMMDDLDDNSDNIDIAKDLINQYDDPKVKAFIDKNDVLQQDADAARPVLKSLSDDLDQPDINASLHNSPVIVSDLMNMRNDINNNKDIAEILRSAMQKNKTDMAKDMMTTLDRLNAKKSLDDAIDAVDDADELLARKDAIVELSDNYKTFTGISSNMDSELKFVMKTDDIKAPDTKVSSASDNNNKNEGFFAWCKNIVVTVKNKIASIV